MDLRRNDAYSQESLIVDDHLCDIPGFPMSLRKKEFIVYCEHCKCGKSDGGAEFVVTVPVRDNLSGLKGTARLRCSVSSSRHNVDLEQWIGDDSQPIQPSADVEKRLLHVVDYVAEKRVCGNRHICPPDVIRAVEQQNRK